MLFVVEFGYLDDVELECIGLFEFVLLVYVNSNYVDFMKDLVKFGDYNDVIKD